MKRLTGDLYSNEYFVNRCIVYKIFVFGHTEKII